MDRDYFQNRMNLIFDALNITEERQDDINAKLNDYRPSDKIEIVENVEQYLPILLDADIRLAELIEGGPLTPYRQEIIEQWYDMIDQLAELQGLLLLKKVNKNNCVEVIKHLSQAVSNKVQVVNQIIKNEITSNDMSSSNTNDMSSSNTKGTSSSNTKGTSSSNPKGTSSSNSNDMSSSNSKGTSSSNSNDMSSSNSNDMLSSNPKGTSSSNQLSSSRQQPSRIPVSNRYSSDASSDQLQHLNLTETSSCKQIQESDVINDIIVNIIISNECIISQNNSIMNGFNPRGYSIIKYNKDKLYAYLESENRHLKLEIIYLTSSKRYCANIKAIIEYNKRVRQRHLDSHDILYNFGFMLYFTRKIQCINKKTELLNRYKKHMES